MPMKTIIVNQDDQNATHDMIFEFPDHWEALLYDEPNGFYRRVFKQFADSKSIDIAALGSDGTLWLIEVKDYRVHRRAKKQSVYDELQKKVRDTLACMFFGAIKKCSFEVRASQCRRIKVVLHLEQREKRSKLHQPVNDRRNGTLKLKQAFRQFGLDAILCDQANIPNQCAWRVVERRR